MNRIFILFSLLVFLVSTGISSASAEDLRLNVEEFKQLYNKLLAGKTLETKTKQGGLIIRKEWKFGSPMDVGAGEFEIPVTSVITKTKDGTLDERIIIEILDRVNNLGGSAIVSEEVRKTTVESAGQEPLSTRELEFNGLFRVAKNLKGGFDIYNFGLIPSGLVEGENMKLAGMMVSNSCFSEDGVTKCVSTIRDYNLGDYKPLVGYTLAEPAGGDVVETAVEAKQ
ncbi:MAG: hypothetical protein ACRENZ_01260 [Thermodesulfobacteriota bacterium]